MNNILLTSKEQRELWNLDNLSNNTRASLLSEEMHYKIVVRKTVSPPVNVDGLDTLIRSLIEISEASREIIRSKISWLEMRQSVKSSKRMEWLACALVGLTVILALPLLLSLFRWLISLSLVCPQLVV